MFIKINDERLLLKAQFIKIYFLLIINNIMCSICVLCFTGSNNIHHHAYENNLNSID